MAKDKYTLRYLPTFYNDLEGHWTTLKMLFLTDFLMQDLTWVAGQAGYIDTLIPRFTACYFPEPFSEKGATIHYERDHNYNPIAGDLIFFDWGCDGGKDHVGIVVSSDANNVYTVEGNTSGEGEAAARCSGSSGCVSKRTRPRDCSIYGYATPKYPTS